MILDFRLRPPLSGIKNTQLFDYDYASRFAAMFQMTPNESVKERSIDLLLKEMEECGITNGVVPYRSWYGSVDEYIEESKLYSDKFYSLFNIEPAPGAKTIPGDTLFDIDRLVTNGPLTAVGMEPSCFSEPYCIDDERLFGVYEKCETDNISIVFTSNIVSPDHFSPFRVANVLKTFPKLRVILIHAWMGWTSVACQQAYMHPNIFISPDCYLLGAPGHRDFIDGANTLIPGQIIFGSAYPLVPLKKAVDYYLHCGFRPEILDDVMYYNGMRALGLLPPKDFGTTRLSLYGA